MFSLNDFIQIKKHELNATVILIGSALLLTIHRYFGSIEFGREAIPILSHSQTVLFMFLTAFILMGLIPVLILHYGFRHSLRTYGIGLGDWKTGLLSTLILLPLISVALLYPASQTPEMRAFYPFDHSITSLSWSFWRFEILRGLLFYTAWEFFFRGFMLFGLRRYVGTWLAVCIQTIPQCLWHIGMPAGEIFASIAGGILFGILAVRTGSILWPFLLHFGIGVVTDGLILVTK